MKSNTRHVYGLILTLFIIGMGLFSYRHFMLGVPLTDSETINSWMVEANLHFTTDHNTPIKASFVIPYMPPHFIILDEYFVGQNYGITTNLTGYNRHVVWSLRRSMGKPQSLYYRAIVRETESNDLDLPKPPRLQIRTLDETMQMAADTVVNRARQSSADIQTFAQATINELNKQDGHAKLLVGNVFNESTLVEAAVLILNQVKIYAMPIKGFYLTQQNHADFKLFLAVYNGKEWIYINPRTSSAGLPKDFFVWQYGYEPMFEITGGKKPALTLTVSPTPINALSLAKTHSLQSSPLIRFSLLQLPVHVQDTYKILLMLPIGSFIILLLRNFIGLKTFGTFMPVLIALAFRETHVIWGIILFTMIVSLGLIARFYLEKLRLLLVPRLACILTIVVLLMIFISIISQNLGIEAGVSVALFPMVILTMTIERMCISWDERGAQDALKSGIGSLVAAVLAFGAMNDAALQYLIFAFPELLLVLLSVILAFGQYRGYRLAELFRFNVLVGEK